MTCAFVVGAEGLQATSRADSLGSPAASLFAGRSPRTTAPHYTRRVPGRALIIGLVVLASLAACRRSEPAFTPPSDSVLLPIADRGWAPGAPEEGWCGEASIQMVGLHYGAWLPQPFVNAVGRSTHVDLWENDVPVALLQLGFTFVAYGGPRGDGRGTAEDFMTWIVSQVRAGRPVIVGAKLFPSEHPDWDVDHLMPVVGFTPAGLVFDSNMEAGQVTVSWAALTSSNSSISFAGPTDRRWGFAVTGLAQATRVRLTDASDGGTGLLAHVSALAAGAWVLHAEGADGGEDVPFITDGGEAIVPVAVPADETRVFSVRPAR